MKKVITIVGIIFVAGAISAGSFFGGTLYEAKKAEQIQASFFEGRGGQFSPDGQFPGSGQLPGGGQMPGGRLGAGSADMNGAIGQVKSIEGDVLQLSTAEDIVTVNLSPDTRVQKTEQTDLSEIKPGMRVTVTGTRDEDGSLNATQIMMGDLALSISGNPAQVETEP